MLQALNNIFMKILTWLPFDPCGPSVPMIPWQSSHKQKFKFNIEWKVKLKQQIANYLYIIVTIFIVTILWMQTKIMQINMTYWLTRWTRWPPWPNKPPSTLKTKHNSVKSYIYEDDHHHHHHHCHTNCTALCSECVAVFISISLCRLAKPPVPQSHLWSPGKWLIWKYNHSSLDLISFLSDSLSRPTLHLSYLFRHIHISLLHLSLSHLSVPIAPHTKTASSLLPSFSILTVLS